MKPASVSPCCWCQHHVQWVAFVVDGQKQSITDDEIAKQKLCMCSTTTRHTASCFFTSMNTGIDFIEAQLSSLVLIGLCGATAGGDESLCGSIFPHYCSIMLFSGDKDNQWLWGKTLIQSMSWHCTSVHHTRHVWSRLSVLSWEANGAHKHSVTVFPRVEAGVTHWKGTWAAEQRNRGTQKEVMELIKGDKQLIG